MEGRCFHHPERETGRSCTRCDRPACADCLTPAPVGSHCWQCLRAARPPARERVRRWNARTNLLVTHLVIAANLTVFVLGLLDGGSALGARGGSLFGGVESIHRRLALYGPALEAGEWYRLVTSGFVHYGLIHVALNMLVLHQLGSLLEPVLGRIRLAALYTAALLAGSFGAVLLRPEAHTAGASGAVFGLLGAAAVGLHLRGVNVWRTPIGTLVVLNVLMTFALPGISIGGHLGGLAGGALVGAVMFREPATRGSILRGTAVAALVAGVAVGGALLTTDEPEAGVRADARRTTTAVAPGIEITDDLFRENEYGIVDASVVVVTTDRVGAAAALDRAAPRFLTVTYSGLEMGRDLELSADQIADPPFTPPYVSPVVQGERGPWFAVDSKGGMSEPMRERFVRILVEELQGAGVRQARLEPASEDERLAP